MKKEGKKQKEREGERFLLGGGWKIGSDGCSIHQPFHEYRLLFHAGVLELYLYKNKWIPSPICYGISPHGLPKKFVH
jgi:hypothetical protein